MAKKVVNVAAISGKVVPTKVGVGQQGFVDGDVWRVDKYLYADIATYANIDVSGNERFQNVLNALLTAFNEKHGCKLISSSYDVKSGKFDRSGASKQPQTKAETPQVVVPQAVAQPQVAVVPQVAVADTSIPISQELLKWIAQAFDSGMTSETIITELQKQNSVELVNAHMLALPEFRAKQQ